MKKILPENWQPASGLELEKAAMDVIKNPKNTLVTAGPGAGKTELLAQKASYLLQTNECKFPRKILAISFKRDAAFNLKQRVKLRCVQSLSQRFDSMTFDAFAKQLLDRFRNGLRTEYKLKADYSIVGVQTIKDTYRFIDENYFQTTDLDIVKFFTSTKLPLPSTTKDEQLRQQVWMSMLKANTVTFPMIMRLAELIIDSNPVLKEYLLNTYSHVFLDEFQDTTQLQYSFFQMCFTGSNTNYTAVGDDKQSIMGWAGAIPEIFKIYKKYTNAESLTLKMNFRSAPKLVELQNHLVQNLLGKKDFATPSSKWDKGSGEAFIWFFKDQNQEMEILCEKIKEWIKVDKITSRDVCILVKQQVEVYTDKLVEHFNANGLSARNENELQDFLTEDIIILLTNFLYIIFIANAVESREIVFSMLANLNASFDDERLLKLHTQLFTFSRSIKKKYPSQNMTANELKEIISEVIKFCGMSKIKTLSHDYKNGDYLKKIVNRFYDFLKEQLNKSQTIIQALDFLMGKNSIPIMTIHKSKGLEYHTVVFVGLEDGAFWSYSTQPDEDKRSFFVALSRAKERVVFTFCASRKDKYGKQRSQSFKNIKQIIDELDKSSCVKIVDYLEDADEE